MHIFERKQFSFIESKQRLLIVGSKTQKTSNANIKITNIFIKSYYMKYLDRSFGESESESELEEHNGDVEVHGNSNL